jgi:hypothetical protein
MATLSFSVPEGSSKAEAEESLRWEADAAWQSGDKEAMVGEKLRIAWQSASGAAEQTHLALAPDSLVSPWQAAFTKQGMTLIAALNSSVVAWQSLPESMSGPSALLQTDGGTVHLLKGQSPQLDLAVRCALNPVDVARHLVRELRAAPGLTLLAQPSPDLDPLRASLADAQVTLPIVLIDLPWADQLCRFAASELQTLPWVDLRLPPVPFLRRPVIWWAAAAVASALIGLPYFLAWQQDLAKQTTSLDDRKKESSKLELKLSELRAEEAEFATLQAQIRQLEAEINASRRGGLNPSQSSQAQPSYVSKLLSSLALGFSRRGRVTDFSADCNGNVVIEGNTPSDAQAQAALGAFHRSMESVPVFKPVTLTTRTATPTEGDAGFDLPIKTGLEFTARALGSNSEVFSINTSTTPTE